MKFEERLEFAVEKLKKVHEVAEKLAVEWFEDVKKYPNQRRMAVLSIMKMLIDISSE